MIDVMETPTTDLETEVAQLLTVYDARAQGVIDQLEAITVELDEMSGILEQVGECYRERGQGVPLSKAFSFYNLSRFINSVTEGWGIHINGAAPRQRMKLWVDYEPLRVDGKIQRDTDGSTRMAAVPGSRRAVTIEEYELLAAGLPKKMGKLETAAKLFGLNGRSANPQPTMDGMVAERQQRRRRQDG